MPTISHRNLWHQIVKWCWLLPKTTFKHFWSFFCIALLRDTIHFTLSDKTQTFWKNAQLEGSTEIKEPKEPKRSQRSSSKNRKLLGSLISVKKWLFFLAPYFPYFTIKRSQHRNTMFNLIWVLCYFKINLNHI